MRKHLNRLIAPLVLAMFVNFMFSNTVFMHSHRDADGKTVTHSHPYVPSSGHTHTAHSIQLIAAFNLAASPAQAAQTIVQGRFYGRAVYLPCGLPARRPGIRPRHIDRLRAPPAA